MKKNINTEHIEGRIYQHNLELKTVSNQDSANFGKQYIGGSIEVAVDEDCLNIIPVNFTYVTATTSKGKANKTYTEMMKIINEGKTVLNDGPDMATKVSIDTALALNDFIAADGTMVSQQVHQGGFVTVVGALKDESQRDFFKTDIVITNINRVEADPEKYINEDYISVRGAVFDFRNSLLPVEFVVINPEGMKYFESLDVSAAEPIYTCVWGRINFKNTVIPVTEESAFGEAAVTTRTRKVRQWVITGASKVPYDFGDDKVMTEAELLKAMQDREVYLADVKNKREEYMAQKNAASTAFGTPAAVPSPSPATSVAQGKFTF